MDDIRPTHCWVTRYLFLNGQDAKRDQHIIEFEDPQSDESLTKSFLEILIEYGQELQLGDYSPIRMDTGRYIVQSDIGFSVVEIDPAWTEDQIEAMEQQAANLEEPVELDFKVWGEIFAQ